MVAPWVAHCDYSFVVGDLGSVVIPALRLIGKRKRPRMENGGRPLPRQIPIPTRYLVFHTYKLRVLY